MLEWQPALASSMELGERRGGRGGRARRGGQIFAWTVFSRRGLVELFLLIADCEEERKGSDCVLVIEVVVAARAARGGTYHSTATSALPCQQTRKRKEQGNVQRIMHHVPAVLPENSSADSRSTQIR